MSREIKFRAWHSEAKDMVYFSLGENNLRAYDMENDDNYSMDITYGIFPIMQYTGFKDKNSTEIYEGDIVRYQYCRGAPVQDVVRFEYSGFDPFQYCGGGEYIPQDCKVIGNLYENPELLEDKA